MDFLIFACAICMTYIIRCVTSGFLLLIKAKNFKIQFKHFNDCHINRVIVTVNYVVVVLKTYR